MMPELGIHQIGVPRVQKHAQQWLFVFLFAVLGSFGTHCWSAGSGTLPPNILFQVFWRKQFATSTCARTSAMMKVSQTPITRRVQAPN